MFQKIDMTTYYDNLETTTILIKTTQMTLGITLINAALLIMEYIRNDISTNAQTLKHNINNVCNLIKLKQAI